LIDFDEGAGWEFDSILRHDLQDPQGRPVDVGAAASERSVFRFACAFKLFAKRLAAQLHAMANATAALSFPTPFSPVKRRACGQVLF
jgi:hypothetical protein